ncbi:MAG: hypothetical protein DMG98_07980 [Acidobacteria bacterium]|nr:MAG: hypothetical protein DMG98_07980 [Acidobacteriota bacterium]
MHLLERTEDARVLASIKFTIAADFRGSRGLIQSFYRRECRGIREIAEKNESRINTDFHGFFLILILDDL